MIDFHAVAVVFSVYVVGVVLPGPNFVAVAHKAASDSRHAALALVAGIVLVNLFWASSAILGIGLVFTALPWLALVVKIAGAGYLIWFGARLFARASTDPVSVAHDAATPSLRAAFKTGVATNLGNPKSVAFYAAVFAAATPRHVSAPTFLAMLATVATVGAVWYGSVAIVFARPSVAAWYRRGKRHIDRVCGSVIVALGLRQLAT